MASILVLVLTCTAAWLHLDIETVFSEAERTKEASVGQRPISLREKDYLKLMNRALDKVKVRSLRGHLHKLKFRANLFFAHEVCIKNMPISTLKKYVDALNEAGVHGVDINMGLSPWIDRYQPSIDKYDKLIEYIRSRNMRLAINPAYWAAHKVRDFKEWTENTLIAWEEIARRYNPDQFVLVHEPSTQEMRMGFSVHPGKWVEFVKGTARVVKRVSPQSRLGAGVLAKEEAYFKKFIQMPELDTISFDIYNLRDLKTINSMVKKARNTGKIVYIEETWRTPYWIPRGSTSVNLDDVISTGIGLERFQELDAKWLETITLYASVMQMETVTPFWTQTFFKYVREGGHALKGDYNLQVLSAIERGDRTATFEVFKELIQRYGVKKR